MSNTTDKHELFFERTVDIAPELVWACWTTPEHIKKWFTPKPWKTIDCEIDLRPGGIFRTTMQSPEGQDFPNTGCYLDVVPNRRLAWTNALNPGFAPASPAQGGDFHFSAIVTMEPNGKGTRYSARVLHANEEDKKKHADMGFEHGWGLALEQLVQLAHKL